MARVDPVGPTEDAALLALVQWLSPAFPIGSFAYSHGLEWAIDAGEVMDATTLEDWVRVALRYGAGRTDAILLCQAMRPGSDLDQLDAFARALAPSAERLRETLELGAAFVAIANALTGMTHSARAYPVALGAAAAPLALAPSRVAALALQGFAAALVSAAVRAVPIGQTEGQRVLAAIHADILVLAEEAAQAPLDAIGSAALGIDHAAMRHETMDVRIYRT